ncbi:hypothetical protein EI94DRAFT_529270 [Lactarius quietus]|nr:hypothetical protein EI94DRAFT_529270 [Lactarius quietus]
MLSNKSIVSFFVAIALASSVTASVAPGSQGDQVKARRGAPNCSVGNPTCCGSTISFSSLSSGQQNELLSDDSDADDSNPNVGWNCVAAGWRGCANNQLPLCCDAIVNTGQFHYPLRRRRDFSDE